MRTVWTVLALLVISFCAYWLRSFPFREKKTKEPQRTAQAEVTARRVQSGNPIRSGRSSGFGYTFLVTFRLDNGTELELYAYEEEYGALREGMTGTLTWKGPYYIHFEQEE